MFFQFSPVRAKPVVEPIAKAKNESEEIETLSLSPFTPIPKLFFENIKIGDPVSRKLLIKNTTSQNIDLHVNLTNIPQDLSISVNWEIKILEKGEEDIFEICWCPSGQISSRYIITFEDFKKIRRDVPVVFKTVEVVPKKNKKTGKQKTAPLKPVTKKYYSSKPSRVSPNKYSPGKKTSCQKIPIIKVNSPPNQWERLSSNLRFNYQNNKENVPTTQGNNSIGFASPKNFSFQIEAMVENERRNTYTLNQKAQQSYRERRETYVLPGKAVDTSTTEFNDSLESTTPVGSPNDTVKSNVMKSTFIMSDRTPLMAYTQDNIPHNTSNRIPLLNEFEHQMKSQSFCFSPLQTPNVHSYNRSGREVAGISNHNSNLPNQNGTFEIITTRVEIMNVSCESYVQANISGETYVKDNSFETYVKSNLSNETYSRNNSANVSPASSVMSISPRTFPQLECRATMQETFEYRPAHKGKDLSSILEETFVPQSFVESTPYSETRRKSFLKRKSDIDYIFSPPKKPNVSVGLQDWSRKGGSAVRVAKHNTGLNIKRMKNKISEESNKEAIVQITKNHTNNVIIQNPFLLATTNSFDPFMVPHLVTNQGWVEKQEINFKKWLNALLTPPKDLASEEQTIDVAKLWQQSKRAEVEVAPSKELVCNIYHTSNRLNNLRRRARELYQSSEIGVVLSKIYVAIDQGKLSIREDRDIRSNLSLKSEITRLLLSYNPLWLRIGLETTYNEILPLTSNSDVIGLNHFITNKLLKNHYLMRKYKTVHDPHYKKDFNNFFLKKYFTLVYFLDRAKNEKLIGHDPCLFCKKGIVKDSKELLIRLAREVLSSMGDITKFLKYSGYVVTHVQTYIHEFDYGVNNLGVDLRDGVRLTKVMELILMKNNLTCYLRVPAISRLQKVHNMKIVFDSLTEAGYQILFDISPKDIVDGHREKTLSFLWQIIYKFETPLITKSATTIQTWFRSLPVFLIRRKLTRQRLKRENAASKIQNWYLRQKFSEKLICFAISLRYYLEHRRRERAAVKIQTNFRMYICRKNYCRKILLIIKMQSRCRGWLVRYVNSHRYRAAVKIQSFIRMSLQHREYFKLKQAVICIQRRYRALNSMRVTRMEYLKLKSSVILVQRKFRTKRITLKEKQKYQKLKMVTVRVQQKYRANKLCRLERSKFITLKDACITIQSWYRAKITRKSFLMLKQSVHTIENKYSALKEMRIQRNKYQLLKLAAISFQRQYRALIEMRLERNYYVRLKASTIIVQRKYRALKMMQDAKSNYQRLRNVTICIQRRFRANILMKRQLKEFQKNKIAAIRIQNWLRASLEMKKQRTNYLSLKFAVSLVEQRYNALRLMKSCRAEFERKKSAANAIQRQYRAQVSMRFYRKQYVMLRSSSILIQNRFRANKLAKQQRAEFLRLRSATLVLQNRFRAQRKMVKYRLYFQSLKRASLLIQAKFRANLLMKQHKSSYDHLRKCVINLQRRYRAQQNMLNIKTEYDNLKRATIILQRRWRAKYLGMRQRKYFLKLRSCVIFAQQRWRADKLGSRERNTYETLKRIVLFSQRLWKANKLRNRDFNFYTSLRLSTILIQQKWRAKKAGQIQKKQYTNLKKAVLFVQQKWRANKLTIRDRIRYGDVKNAALVIQRRWRAKIMYEAARNNYIKLKAATLVFQQRWRAKKLGQIQKRDYDNLRKTVIFIQQHWRANVLSKRERTRYYSVRKASIIIQRRYIAKILFEEAKNNYTKLKAATLVIQRRWRARKLGQIQKRDYDNLRKTVIFIQQHWRANVLSKRERTRYCNIKKAVIIIQRRYRAKKMCEEATDSYQKLRTATVTFQNRWRAKKAGTVQKKYYENLRKTAVFIQQKWRANELAFKERNRYCEIKKSAILLQRLWRAKKMRDNARTYYRQLKSSTVIIQQKWRAKKACDIQRRKYQGLKKAAIVLQRRWIAQKLAICQKKHYDDLKRVTIFTQRRWRANKLKVQVFDAYYQLKKASIVIQQRWRARKLCQTQKYYYHCLRKSVVLVQRKWRANTSMQRQKHEYNRIRESVISIQSKWRMQKLRKEYLLLRQSVINVQQKWRAQRLMVLERERFVILKHTTIFIQRIFRANILMRKSRSWYLHLKYSAIVIQKFYRGYKMMKQLQAQFMNQRRLIVQLQTISRGYIIRKQHATFLSDEAREERKTRRKQNLSATSIQRIWKGYKCRKSLNPACQKIYQRLVKANESANPEKTLAARSMVALKAFASDRTTLFHITKALQELEYTTRHSQEVCEKVATVLPDQLYVMLCATSRSLPEMNACILSVKILITFCKYSATKPYSFKPEFIDNLIVVMLHWCDKESLLFPYTCTLLWLFAHEPEWKNFIISLPNFSQQFEKICSLVMRKESMVKKASSKSNSLFLSYKNLPLPNIKPDCGLACDKTRPNTFTNSVHAMLELSNILTTGEDIIV